MYREGISWEETKQGSKGMLMVDLNAMKYCGRAPLLLFWLILFASFWRANTQEPIISSTRMDGYVYGGAISPDGRYIAVDTLRSTQREDGTWDNAESVLIFAPGSAKIVARIPLESADQVRNAPLTTGGSFVGYCDDAKYLAIYDKNGTLYIVNTSSYSVEGKISLGLEAAALHGPSGGTTKIEVACSMRGNVVATAAHDGAYGDGLIKLFALPSGQQIAKLKHGPAPGQISSIAVSPDGSKIALLLKNAQWPLRPISSPNVEVYGARHLNLLSRFSTGDAAQTLIFSGESELATDQAPGSSKNSQKAAVRLWDTGSGHEQGQLYDAKRDIRGPISVSANGKLVLGYVPEVRGCAFCNGLEGSTEVKEQKYAIWNKNTGKELFRSAAFGPILKLFQPQCILSQDGRHVLVYWPSTEITPRSIPVK